MKDVVIAELESLGTIDETLLGNPSRACTGHYAGVQPLSLGVLAPLLRAVMAIGERRPSEETRITGARVCHWQPEEGATAMLTDLKHT